jgi:HEAT repeat protein
MCVAGTLMGCSVSPAVQAAREPNYPKLEKAIDAEKKSGELDEGEVEDIAEAIAEGEIERAKGVAGEAILPAFSGCAKELEGALEDRFDKGDDIGAVAASLLLSAGLVDEDEYVDFATENDPRPAYRALGARGLIDEDTFELRRKMFVDLDERVRSNALKAALTAPSAADFDSLVEAARVDPLPAARASAVRALGRVGGERAVIALKDIWLRADPRWKESLVAGYIAPPTFEVGGRAELVRIAEEGGAGSIAAAVVLSRVAVDEAPDRQAREVARQVLLRAIKLGTREDRTFAMIMAPSDKDVLAALREAKADSDAGIALVALGRLAYEGDDKEKKAARDKLLEIAKSDDPEANRAMGELAGMSDKRVTPLLEKQLGSESPFARAYAARQLVLLGEYQKAAKALADKDVNVRAGVACAVLGKK